MEPIELPSYIYQPSTTNVSLPVITQKCYLPFKELTWQDFERLCFRLIKVGREVKHCYIYGNPGQKQYGIDIFAQKEAQGKYSVFQCKKVEDFSHKDLKEVIKKFEKGKWYASSEEFVICIATAYSATQDIDYFESERIRLKSENISLKKWDAIELSEILKEHPEIVDDFFGRAWVEVFCGKEQANRLNDSSRLSADQIIAYRQSLKAFYSVVFNTSDVTAIASNAKMNFIEKYVIPDVNHKDEETKLEIEPSNNRIDLDDIDTLNKEYYPYMHDGLKKLDRPLPISTLAKTQDTIKSNVQRRISIDVAISQNAKNVILGDAGIGKSTFLKFLILDLLSDNPVLINCVRRWGEYLPIWIPFAYITKQLRNGENDNIHIVIERWFSSYDEGKYKHIIQRALADNKILLVVDGLDEWTSESVALQAIRRLEIFVETKGIAVLYSSRPFGYKILEQSIQNVTKNNLAPFSQRQQVSFLTVLFRNTLSTISLDEEERDNSARSKAVDFVEELTSLDELKELSTNPLMLSVLFVQKIRGGTLPRNRFKAYEELTTYLIEQHPQSRRTDANITDDIHELRDYLNIIYAHLAYSMYCQSSEGIYDKKDCRNAIQNYLQSELGYDKSGAIKEASTFIELGENFIGILTEKSPNDIAFAHRQFQEFLCAKYIGNVSSFEELKGIVTTKCYDLTWHQPIFYIFHFCNREGEFLSLLDILKNELDKLPDQGLRLLYFNIAINVPQCPYRKSREILNLAFDDFTYCSNIDFKDALLEIILNGIHNPKIGEEILKWLKKWNPYRYQYRDYRLDYLDKIISKPSCRNYLRAILFNGNTKERFLAAQQIGIHLKAAFCQDFHEWLKRVCFTETDVETKAFALYALYCYDNYSDILSQFVEAYQDIEVGVAPIVEFMVVKCKVTLNNHIDADLDRLLAISTYLPYELRNEFAAVIVNGWKNSNYFWAECCAYLDNDETKIDFTFRQIFLLVFVSCFHERPESVDVVIQQVFKDGSRFSINLHERDTWDLLVKYYAGNEKLSSVLEELFFSKSAKSSFDVLETYSAALICRTEKAKTYLIDNLQKYSHRVWIYSALFQVWKDDAQVKRFFAESINNEDNWESIFLFANYILSVDDTKAFLCKLLFNKDFNRRSDVLSKLLDMDSEWFERQYLNSFIVNELHDFRRPSLFSSFDAVIEKLIITYPQNEALIRIVDQETLACFERFGHLKLMIADEREVEGLLDGSLNLDESLRLKMIDKLTLQRDLIASRDLRKLIIDQDENINVKSYVAVGYYSEVAMTRANVDEELELLKNKIFFRPPYSIWEYGKDRQIALLGFTLLRKLKEFKEILLINSKGVFDYKLGIDLHSSSMNIQLFRIILSSLSDFYNVFSKEELATLLVVDESHLFELGASFIEKEYQAYSIMMADLERNTDRPISYNHLKFLAKHQPRSNETKRAFLNRLQEVNRRPNIAVGQLMVHCFANDPSFLDTIIKNGVERNDIEKVIYIGNTDPDNSILQKIFDELEVDKNKYSSDIANYVRLLKADIDRVVELLELVFGSINDFKLYNMELVPSISNRIFSDKLLQQKLAKVLVNGTSTVSRKISIFYILNRCMNVDENFELQKWRLKEIQIETKRNAVSIGYNIFTGETCSLQSALN